MVPTTYTELFIFLVAAVGAALFFGTGAALVRYRRTGAFPGADEGGDAGAGAAVVRCALGALIVVLCLAALAAVRS